MSLVDKRGGVGAVGPIFTEFQKTIESSLQQAEKDNGFIYHLRVPDPASLPAVEKAVVAKPTPLGDQLYVNFTGRFGNVIHLLLHL